MSTKVVGLDIGSRSVRAVELSAGNKLRPNLIRFHEVELPSGAVIRGEVVEPEAVASALKKLWTEGGFKTKNVVLGTGDQRILVRDLSVPKMSLKHIRQTLPFQVQSMLQAPLADSLLDFYPVSESLGDQGPIINGLLIAAEASPILSNIHAAERAGLTPVEVDLIPFALNRLLVGRAKVMGTVALIDVGADTTSIVVVIDGVPRFVRIIPAGGEELTQALKAGLEIDGDKAEALKRNLRLGAESQLSDDPRSKAILETVTSELLSSLRSTVNYFNNTWPQNPVQHVILAGGGARLAGFAEALSEMTRIPVNHADPFSLVALPRGRKGKKLPETNFSMTAALGLALRSVS